VAFSGELSEPGSKLGEVPWIFGEYNVVEDAEVIERGDPKPIPESTDWGLLPMLLDQNRKSAFGDPSEYHWLVEAVQIVDY